MNVKIGLISDLHNYQEEWYDNLTYNQWGWEVEQKWKEMDILMFAGDCSARGSERDVDAFMNWFNLQPGIKVMISGNHDFFFDVEYLNTKPRHSWEKEPETAVKEMLSKYPNIHYLNDSGINLFGLNIWGSPVQPWFHNWAFNRTRNTTSDGDFSENIPNGIKQHWDLIPANTDILITHGPPMGHGDLLHNKFRRAGEDPNVGCIDLLNKINEIKPRINVFGHIHEGYGITKNDDTTFINASSLNENYKPVNPPIFIDLDV